MAMRTRRSTTTGPMTCCPSSTCRMYDIIRAFEMMNQGKMNGYICQGFNPLQARSRTRPRRCAKACRQAEVPRRRSIPWRPRRPLSGRTSAPQNPSDAGRDPDRRCSSCPRTCFAEEDGSLVNSARWLQWHWKAAIRRAKPCRRRHLRDRRHLSCVSACYLRQGWRHLPDPITQAHLELHRSGRHRRPTELAKGI